MIDWNNPFSDMPDGSIDKMYNEYLEAKEEYNLAYWEKQMQDKENEIRMLKCEVAQLKLDNAKLEFKLACGL